MESTGLIAFLIIGAIAGWLAGILMKGGGFGLLGNNASYTRVPVRNELRTLRGCRVTFA